MITQAATSTGTREASAVTALTRRSLLMGAVALLPLMVEGCGITDGGAQTVSPTFVATLCGIVMPKTTTPGATETKVPEFVEHAFGQGLFGGSATTTATLEAILDKRADGVSFVRLSMTRQRELITALDDETYAHPTAGPVVAIGQAGGDHVGAARPAADSDDHKLWRMMKNAILVGYYTSEPGASVELTYELVPGRYDADIPLKAGTPYLSNTWVANLA